MPLCWGFVVFEQPPPIPRYLATMRTITFTANNEQDYELVLKLAQRLGLKYREETLAAPAPEPAPLMEAERQHHLRILAQGGSGKSIPDPVAWQREIRADRPLPGRD